MASTTNRVMKPSESEQLGPRSAAKKRSRRSGNSRGGLDVREILPHPAEGEKCLLTSPSIGLPSWVFKVNLQTRFVTHKG